MLTTPSPRPRNLMTASPRRLGFTMIELLVAIGVFFLLLTIILVPIRLAFDTLNIGRAGADLQQAGVATLGQIETDLQQAIYVFPNSKLEGVTTTGGYPLSNFPYVRSTDTTDVFAIHGPCEVGSNAEAWNNQSRIDMILPLRSSGVVELPARSGSIVVTYYPRRLDVARPFDPDNNPIVLFRAQFPYQKSDGSTFGDDDNSSNPKNADLTSARFNTTCGGSAAQLDRQALWISHNHLGEANLEPLCDKDASAPSGGTTVFASHTLATPRGMGLAGTGLAAPPSSFVPETSFLCSDTNSDGKVDRVDVTLVLQSYSASTSISSNGRPTGQEARFTRSMDCPNVQ